MPWWETVVDAIPVVGTGYRAVRAVAAELAGDHETAKQQWAEAGMNLAGDALGLVTGGAGKVASTAAETAAKVAIETATKEGAKAISKKALKEAAKQGTKAAIRSARKQLTKKAMKEYAKKYVKKKVKKALKDGVKGAAEAYLKDGVKGAAEAYEDEEGSIQEEMHRFSGHWKGFYRQWGSNHDVECMLIVDHDGNMAGRGSDISSYTVSGKMEPDGTFTFTKQYEGPKHFHVVIYSGSVEWQDQPVLQGKWKISSDGQTDCFVLIADDIGLEASVISLTCCSAEDVLAMDEQEKREEIIDALSEITIDISRDELASFSDQKLISIAQTFTIQEFDEEDATKTEN